MKIYLLIFMIALSGCAFTKTVYVPHGQAVRLRQELKNVKVWVRTSDDKTLPSSMTIPEGWFCLPKD